MAPLSSSSRSSSVKSPRSSTSSAQATGPNPTSSVTPLQHARVKAADKELDKKERQHRREVDQMAKEKAFERQHADDPFGPRYGDIPHSGDHIYPDLVRENFANIPKDVGDTVFFRARIERVRPMSAKLAFIVFRQQLITVQGVLHATSEEEHKDTGVSELMVRWAEKLAKETVVLVSGKVREATQEVKSVEIHHFEFDILKMYVLSPVTDALPWTVSDASRPVDVNDEEGEHHATASNVMGRVGGLSLASRLAHRPVDLRTPTNQAIFRIQALTCAAARAFLDLHGFIEIHTPKLQPAATESGSSVFKVDYFGRAAFLAQSPQLAKETCISGDLERVYEIGPVFRAENSNTHRHMTEFTGLDVEMAIETSYLEARNLIDALLKHIFNTLQSEQNAHLLAAVKKQFPHDDLVFPEETVVIPFLDGIKMLKESGWKEEDGEEMDEYDDLSRKAEVRLGQLVKEKFFTDYYILDKFPIDVRPFYTMPDPENPRLSNSFDIFVRGEEILSGGQRLHSATELIKRLEAVEIDPKEMSEYVNAFKWGMPPHAGGGIGLERLVMLFLKLGNLRNASLFPRDPKSFPDAPPASARKTLNTVALPHVDRIVGWDEPNVISEDTMRLNDHPRLEDLIATYGDSTNTAWTDPGYKIWRQHRTGAAIGYKVSKSHAISWGYPLCAREDLSEVIEEYIKWLEEHKLKPIWLNVDATTEKILAERHGWRALMVTSDQRILPQEDSSHGDKNVQRKVRASEKAGLKVEMLKGEISAELRAEIDERIKDWQSHRQGAQIHTTMVRPWADCTHRTYFVARDRNHKTCGLISLAKLSPEHGYQIKWSLEFPGAPSGTSEFMLHHVIGVMREAGVACATFGAGANDTIEVVDNIKGVRAKLLASTYKAIVSSFHLTNKSRYREKFGAFPDPLYVCYKEGSIGFSGVEAIMNTVKDTGNRKEKKRKRTSRSLHEHNNDRISRSSGESSAADSTTVKLQKIRTEQFDQTSTKNGARSSTLNSTS